jgi:hypothetical protein
MNTDVKSIKFHMYIEITVYLKTTLERKLGVISKIFVIMRHLYFLRMVPTFFDIFVCCCYLVFFITLYVCS